MYEESQYLQQKLITEESNLEEVFHLLFIKFLECLFQFRLVAVWRNKYKDYRSPNGNWRFISRSRDVFFIYSF
jgi:hypothetical protein